MSFFTDNRDIQFQFEHLDLDQVIRFREGDFAEAAEHDHAPADKAETIDGYRRILEIVGELAGERIAPRAVDVDLEGCTYDDGVVTFPEGTRKSLDELAQADMMGFTLPRAYGGLNCPTVLYVLAIEMVSRADASLMNIFGLQDIAETINDFGSDEQKAYFLPKFADGSVTGAMALTEPDAGSDLQAVQLKAVEKEDGSWVLHGVKRFITNGCGDILLVLARSEEGSEGGRGLSMFVCEKCPQLRVRRIEDKLGIHGSPTCELQFNDVPAQLVGQRRRGLSRYVMALMNGARLGISAQGVGIAEAAYRAAAEYALSREQFGRKIHDMPPVYEMLTDMRLEAELARALMCDTAIVVDLAHGYEEEAQADRKNREAKAEAARYKKLAAVLTPMSKYYASEVAIRNASSAIQVHGGSGFTRDYEVERLLRDARITNIYEGTSQLQVVAAIGGVTSGALSPRYEAFAALEAPAELQPLREKLLAAQARLDEVVAYVKEKDDRDYLDYYARRVVDMALDIYLGWILVRDGARADWKLAMAKKFAAEMLPRVFANADCVLAGDRTTIENYRSLLD
jgi:alkylation response protein AidB-like acyl-CoA dehydrogenase